MPLPQGPNEVRKNSQNCPFDSHIRPVHNTHHESSLQEHTWNTKPKTLLSRDIVRYGAALAQHLPKGGAVPLWESYEH